MEKVSKEMMNKLNYIRAHTLEYQTMPLQFLNDVAKCKLFEISEWYWQQNNPADAQFKLIEHVFGDTPQFEAEKSKKYVVRTKVNRAFLAVYKDSFALMLDKKDATLFDTREEAEMWTNSQTEVVEVEE